MPILPAEPNVFPPSLLMDEAPGADPAARWWCLHARPRQEKATARYLHSQRIPHYLPLVVQEGRTPAGRKIRSVVPLFTGYLFLLGDDRQRVEAQKGNNLVNILEVADQEGLTRDLGQVRRMLESGLPIAAEPAHSVGVRVRILEGPLRGLVGVVVRRGKRDQFVAVVRFLGKGATVDLEDWQVEPVTD